MVRVVFRSRHAGVHRHGLHRARRRAVRTDSSAFFLLAATVPMTVLYIARPSIAPDHLWAMRRYLPVVLPGMTIAAAAAAIWVTSTVDALVAAPADPRGGRDRRRDVDPGRTRGQTADQGEDAGWRARRRCTNFAAIAGPHAAIAVDPGQFLVAELPAADTRILRCARRRPHARRHLDRARLTTPAQSRRPAASSTSSPLIRRTAHIEAPNSTGRARDDRRLPRARSDAGPSAQRIHAETGRYLPLPPQLGVIGDYDRGDGSPRTGRARRRRVPAS